MPWTPENNDQLQEYVDAAELEASSMKLWREFLAGYFTGGRHFDVDYPLASLSFQQAQVPQPLNGLNLHLVTVTGLKPRVYPMPPHGCQTFQRVNWTFYLRANVLAQRPDGHNAESLARLGSDTLYQLLTNDALLIPLHRAGLFQIRPAAPKLVPSLDYAMRSLDCSGTLFFPARSPTVLAVGGNGDVLGV